MGAGSVYGRKEYSKQSIPNMNEGPEETECGIFQTVRNLKERVKKGEAEEGGRHQTGRREG